MALAGAACPPRSNRTYVKTDLHGRCAAAYQVCFPPSPIILDRMPSTITERYAALVREGEIERDPAQEAVAARLTRLERRVAQHRLSRKSSHLGWLFGKNAQQEGPIRGLYIHGEVGRGKTMLMDLFFAASAVTRKRRVHFHEFMGEVHERVHVYRQKIKSGEVDD